MIDLKRTNSKDSDFQALIVLLDIELAIRDGDDHAFFEQFNQVDNINHVVVAYKDEEPVGCGAIKSYDHESMEVKRVFVDLTHRGNRIAVTVMDELEKWAQELGYQKTILETGFKQPEAIRLYERIGYQRIPNFGQYEGVELSICFAKKLSVKSMTSD